MASRDRPTPRGKPLVVNIWASWCPPCQAEAPTTKAVSEKAEFAGKVGFVGDRPARTGLQTGLAQVQPWATPSEPPRRWRIAIQHLQGRARAMPSTLVLDREGRIAAFVGGPVSAATLTDGRGRPRGGAQDVTAVASQTRRRAAGHPVTGLSGTIIATAAAGRSRRCARGLVLPASPVRASLISLASSAVCRGLALTSRGGRDRRGAAAQGSCFGTLLFIAGSPRSASRPPSSWVGRVRAHRAPARLTRVGGVIVLLMAAVLPRPPATGSASPPLSPALRGCSERLPWARSSVRLDPVLGAHARCGSRPRRRRHPSTSRAAVLAGASLPRPGLPFLLLATAWGAGWFNAFLRRHQRAIHRFGGALLLVVGLLLVTGLWDHVTVWLQQRIGATEVILLGCRPHRSPSRGLLAWSAPPGSRGGSRQSMGPPCSSLLLLRRRPPLLDLAAALRSTRPGLLPISTTTRASARSRPAPVLRGLCLAVVPPRLYLLLFLSLRRVRPPKRIGSSRGSYAAALSGPARLERLPAPQRRQDHLVRAEVSPPPWRNLGRRYRVAVRATTPACPPRLHLRESGNHLPTSPHRRPRRPSGHIYGWKGDVIVPVRDHLRRHRVPVRHDPVRPQVNPTTSRRSA